MVGAAVGGERRPQPVHLGLVGAVDLDRGRLGERELRSAVQTDEPLVADAEVDGQHVLAVDHLTGEPPTCGQTWEYAVQLAPYQAVWLVGPGA